MSAAIILENWQGLIPKMEPHLLPANALQVAENIDLLSGAIRPYFAPAFHQSLGTETRKSVFLHRGMFLEFEEDTDVIKNPNVDDIYDRIYYTSETGRPKVIGWIAGIQTELDLGVPAPLTSPIVAIQNKTAGAFTREWHYFYEELDGTQVDNGDLVEGVDVTESVIGETYVIGSIPPPVLGTPTAIFVPWFEAFDLSGSSLGKVYANNSRYVSNNTFLFNGAVVALEQDIVGSTSTITLTYNEESGATFTLSRVYLYTFVNVFGEESAPSPESITLDVPPIKDVLISGLETTIPGGTYQPVKKCIYRTETDSSNNVDYKKVAEVDISTTSFLDTLTSSQIPGDLLQTNDWSPPPTDLRGLVLHPAGFAAGFDGRQVWVSEIGAVHAYNTENIVTTLEDIVALGITLNTIAVTTKGRPESLTGNEPGLLVQDRYVIRQANASKKSTTDVEGAVVYASPDGLVALAGTNSSLLTNKRYRFDQWQAINPSTMIGASHDRKYYGFTDSTFVIFDFDDQASAFTTTTEQVQGLYSDTETDTLYMIQAGNLTRWNQGTGILTGVARSRRYQLLDETSWAVGEVIASSYPIIFRAITPSGIVFEKTVTSNKQFKFPGLRREKQWEFEVEGTAVITRIAVGTSINAIMAARS